MEKDMTLFDFANDFTEEEESVFSTKPTNNKKKRKQRTFISDIYSEEEKIVNKYKAGMHVRQIMREHGISTSIVYKVLKRNNVPLRGKVESEEGINVPSSEVSTTLTKSKTLSNTVTESPSEGDLEASYDGKNLNIWIPSELKHLNITLTLKEEN